MSSDEAGYHKNQLLLLIGTLIPVVVTLIEVAAFLYADYFWRSGWLTLAFLSLPTAIAAMSLAAGLAGRSAAVIRPPLPLACIAIAAVFLIALTFTLLNISDASDYSSPSWDILMAQTVAANLANWLVDVAWLAILWVGLSAWRQVNRSWAWLVVAAAGALHLLADLPNYVSQLYRTLVPPDLTSMLDGTGSVAFVVNPYYLWQLIATGVAGALLLAALVIGLRPSIGGEAPGERAAEPADDPASRPAPDTEVAGETAGH